MIPAIILFLIIIFLAVIRTIHVMQLKNESSLRKPEGTLVDIEGKRMNVYTEGNGSETIVFMAGHGTASPVLDFRSLYSLLSDEYRIAVVEKFGYGYSDVSDRSRDIDTMLGDTRKALASAGINGPYILCPHSMSGFEAIYWAQKYPEEVKAIIGLDIAYPGLYNVLRTSKAAMKYLTKVLQAAAYLGITRLVPSFAEREAIVNGTLNDEEKKRYRAMFYYRTATADMSREAACAHDNSDIVEKNGIPDVPFLMFLSDGSDMNLSASERRENAEKYVSQYRDGQITELRCGHYMHNFKYHEISDEIKSFIRRKL